LPFARVLLFFPLATHESERVGRKTFVHDRLLMQRKTLPGEDRPFRWDERRLTFIFQMRKRPNWFQGKRRWRRAIGNLPGMPKPLDLDATKDFYHSLYTAFPDLKHKIIEQISAGNKVVTRWEATEFLLNYC